MSPRNEDLLAVAKIVDPPAFMRSPAHGDQGQSVSADEALRKARLILEHLGRGAPCRETTIPDASRHV